MLRDRLRDFVRDVFDGQASSVVLSLVDDANLSADELRAIERRIADAEQPITAAADTAAPAKRAKKERK